MNIKSKIYEAEQVDNKNPRAKADTKYFAAYLVDVDGNSTPLLFTDFDIEKASRRALANLEDVPPQKVSVWDRLKLIFITGI